MDLVHQTIYQGNLVQFGLFRCHPSHPSFVDTGPIRRGHLLVFPRTCVRITHEGGNPVVANPNVVMFYNEGQSYRRAAVSQKGDWCEWFAYCPTVIADALEGYDPTAIERLDHPFALTHGPSDATSYMAQRLAVDHVLTAGSADRLQIEELMLSVLYRVVNNAFGQKTKNHHSPRAATERSYRELVQFAQEYIATHFDQQLLLDRIAQKVHSSPYHLCRIFRQRTGVTIHKFQDQLRLRTALNQLPDSCGDLSGLAHDLGYSSHSHFSNAFRRTFGLSPSHLSKTPSAQKITELRKILIV